MAEDRSAGAMIAPLRLRPLLAGACRSGDVSECWLSPIRDFPASGFGAHGEPRLPANRRRSGTRLGVSPVVRCTLHTWASPPWVDWHWL